MKKRIIVVGGREEVGGYRLAGAKTYDADSPGLAEKLAGADAIVLVTRDAAARLAADMERIKAKNIVQEIPSDPSGYARVREIIKSTVGLDLQ